MTEPRLSADVLAEIFECDRRASRNTVSPSRRRLHKLLAENDFAVVEVLRTVVLTREMLDELRTELIETQRALRGFIAEAEK